MAEKNAVYTHEELLELFKYDDSEDEWDEETQKNWEEKMDSVKWPGKE